LTPTVDQHVGDDLGVIATRAERGGRSCRA
jgi:hypothetical protein